MHTVEYQWIDNNLALAQLCERLSQQEAIALDTEFVRSRTYFPHVGLLQIADTEGVYLIDPLAIDDTQPFANLLQNPKVVKVVHACSEDLEVFQHAFGVLPVALFDTQIAAGFAGYGVSIGYANLLRVMEDIDIPKHETRSDWLQRPLSDSQLSYAALDVVYLLTIYKKLSKDLQAKQRLSWVESDCIAIVDKLKNTHHQEQYYLRVKSAWKLNPKQLSVLKALCAWREDQAQERDVPRSRVIKDSSLYDIAVKLPQSVAQLKPIKELFRDVINESGETLVAIIEQSSTNVDDYPAALPRPLSIEQTAVLKKLKQTVRTIAESLDVPQELLARKKDYEALIRSASDTANPQYTLPSSLTDWRETVVGTSLLDCLQQLSQEKAV